MSAGAAPADARRREWRVERVGWALMALLVGAAALGLFGGGPLARGTAHGAEGLSLHYPRYARARAPVRLDVAAPTSGVARLRISESFARAVELEALDPPPRRVVSRGPERIYEFEATPPLRSLGLRFRYLRAGRVEGSVAADDGPALTFSTLVFP